MSADFSWTHDPEVDALYVYFVDPDPMDVEIGPSVWWTEEFAPDRVMIDWADPSHAFGVEVLLGGEEDFLADLGASGGLTVEQYKYVVDLFFNRPWEDS